MSNLPPLPKVVHKQVYRNGPFGGILNTTLCGRVRNGVEYNCSASESEVTCKFCLKRLAVHAAKKEIKND